MKMLGVLLACSVFFFVVVSCVSVQPQNISASANRAMMPDWVKKMNCKKSSEVKPNMICAVGMVTADSEDAARSLAEDNAKVKLLTFINESVATSSGSQTSIGLNKTANSGGAEGSVSGMVGGKAAGTISTSSEGISQSKTTSVSTVTKIENIAGIEYVDYFWDIDGKKAYVIATVSIEGLRGAIEKALTEPAQRENAYKLLGVEPQKQ